MSRLLRSSGPLTPTRLRHTHPIPSSHGRPYSTAPINPGDFLARFQNSDSPKDKSKVKLKGGGNKTRAPPWQASKEEYTNARHVEMAFRVPVDKSKGGDDVWWGNYISNLNDGDVEASSLRTFTALHNRTSKGDLSSSTGGGKQPVPSSERHANNEGLLKNSPSLTLDPTAPNSAQGATTSITTLAKDILSTRPAFLLGRLLDDVLPSTTKVQSRQQRRGILPHGAHLAYFPLLLHASELAGDGADPSHVPPGFALAEGWEEWDTSGKGVRLWKGGILRFRKDWTQRLSLRDQGVAGKLIWECEESVDFLPPTPADERTATRHVDISMLYLAEDVRKKKWLYEDTGRGEDNKLGEEADDRWLIRERRQLAFVPGGKDAIAAAESRVIKSRHTPSAIYPFSATATHLFQFSALTSNAHFIHLHPTRALVHGPFLLAALFRGLEQTFLLANDVAGLDRTFRDAWRVMQLTYRNLRPARAGQPLRVCVRRPGHEGRMDVVHAGLGEDGVEALRASTGGGLYTGDARLGGQWENWDVWIEAEDGGMVVKASALVIVPPTSTVRNEKQTQDEAEGNLTEQDNKKG